VKHVKDQPCNSEDAQPSRACMRAGPSPTGSGRTGQGRAGRPHLDKGRARHGTTGREARDSLLELARRAADAKIVAFGGHVRNAARREELVHAAEQALGGPLLVDRLGGQDHVVAP